MEKAQPPQETTRARMTLSRSIELRDLFRQLVGREIASRVQGSYLGLFWLVMQPLLLLASFALVFGTIFKVRWNGLEVGQAQYALVIFAGMALHGLLADCIARAPSLITSRASFVKKVVFPIEILPVVQVVAAGFQTTIAIGLWLIAVFGMGGGHVATTLALPLLLAPLILHALGITWFLSALGVYVRDVGQAAGLLTTLLLFLSPVFYPASAVPAGMREVMFLNPLAFAIEALRGGVLEGTLPEVGSYVLQLIYGLLVALGGFLWFRATRKGFADVL